MDCKFRLVISSSTMYLHRQLQRIISKMHASYPKHRDFVMLLLVGGNGNVSAFTQISPRRYFRHHQLISSAQRHRHQCSSSYYVSKRWSYCSSSSSCLYSTIESTNEAMGSSSMILYLYQPFLTIVRILGTVL